MQKYKKKNTINIILGFYCESRMFFGKKTTPPNRPPLQ